MARSFYNRNVWATSYTRQSLEKYYTSLAKEVNRRLNAIENSKSIMTGKPFQRFGAYEQMAKHLEDMGKSRVDTDPSNLNRYQIRNEITRLQSFVNAKTGSRSGLERAEKARIKTFESKGIRFASDKEFYDFFNSELYAELDKKYGSKRVLEFFENDREYSDKIPISDVINKLEEFRGKTGVGYNDIIKELDKLEGEQNG